MGSSPLASPGKKYKEVSTNSQILIYHYVMISVVNAETHTQVLRNENYKE